MESSKCYILFALLLSSIFNLAQEISFPGESKKSCRTTLGEDGVCVVLKDCASAMTSIRKGIMPSHCYFRGNTPIVCCPLLGLSDENLSERITELKVIPPNINFVCGIRGTVTVNNTNNSFRKRSINPIFLNENSAQFSRVKRAQSDFKKVSTFRRVKREEEFSFHITVVGGETAQKNSWPWMALLGRKKGSKTNFFCSAILINENFVVTAAHCVLSLDPFFVRLGEHDYGLGFGKPISNTIQDFGMDNVLFHPKFNLDQGYHDVALVKLNTSVTFKSEISPICLPWNNLEFEELLGQKVTVAGWGKLGFGGAQSTVLQEVNVTVFNASNCEKSYSTLSDYGNVFPQGMNNENILCAGDVNGAKDACTGDSGGPIMYLTAKTKFIIWLE